MHHRVAAAGAIVGKGGQGRFATTELRKENGLRRAYHAPPRKGTDPRRLGSAAESTVLAIADQLSY